MRIRIKYRFRDFLAEYGNLRDEMHKGMIFIVLPLILCIVLFGATSYVVTRQARQRSEMLAENCYVQCNTMFREVELISDNLQNDSFLQATLNSGTFDFDEAVKVCHVIQRYESSASYISQILVISEALDHIYSEDAYFTLSSLDVFLSNLGISQEQYDSFGLTPEMHIVNNGYSHYCYVPILDSAGNRISSMIISLSMPAFRHIFLNLDAQFCCIFNESNNGFYISSYVSSPYLNLDWRNPAAISDLIGERVICAYYEGSEYTCVVAVSRSEYAQPLWVIILGFLAYGCVVLAIEFSYLFRVTRQRYRNVDAMLSVLPKRFVEGSGYSVLIDNIQQALTAYHNQQADAVNRKQSKALHDLLHGYYGETPPSADLARTGLDTDAHRFYVVGFYILDAHDIKATTNPSEIFTSLRVIIRSIVETLAPEQSLKCASFTDAHCLVVVFSGQHEEKMEENVAALCTQVAKMLQQSYNVSIQATIGSAVDDFRHLAKAYEEVRSLHNFASSIDSAASLIVQDKLYSSGSYLLDGNFLRQTQILVNTILAGKYDLVPTLVRALLDQHIAPLRKNYDLVDSRLRTIQNLLMESIFSAEEASRPSEEAIEALRSAHSISELNRAAEMVFPEMQERSSRGSVGDITDLACEYIMKHISDQNLNVSEISDAAGVSVRHLTKLFWQRFNMTVADYVNARRIDMAKELLKNRSVSITQIAQEVGYYSTDTLARNFRKLEGITPTEYRNTIIKLQ